MSNLQIKVKKMKRICDIRNCKNTDTYAIIRGNEFSKPIFLCKECIKELYNTVFCEEQSENKETYNSEVAENKETFVLVTEFACVCGKSFKSEKGLKSHISRCEVYKNAQHI